MDGFVIIGYNLGPQFVPFCGRVLILLEMVHPVIATYQTSTICPARRPAQGGQTRQLFQREATLDTISKHL